MNRLFESVNDLFDSESSFINEGYKDDIVRDLGIEKGSDEESTLDDILNSTECVYDVFVLNQVGPNNFQSSLYGTYDSEEQAYDVVAEIRAQQGVNAYVEERDEGEVVTPSDYVSSIYASGLEESSEDFADLYKVREDILADDTDRLLLHTRNKKTGEIGCASFFGDNSDNVVVYEGRGDGSDDKEMSFKDFVSNYDYELADEDATPFNERENLFEDPSNTVATLFQVKSELTRDFNFESLAMLHNMHKDVDLSNYDKIGDIDYSKYTDSTDDHKILEVLYNEGNSNQSLRDEFPKMRSISVSDIILLNGKYYYCDSFGFADVTDDINSKEITEADNNLKSEVINYFVSKYGKDFELEDNVNDLTDRDEIIDSIIDSYADEGEDVSIEEFIDSLIDPHGLVVVKSKEITEANEGESLEVFKDWFSKKYPNSVLQGDGYDDSTTSQILEDLFNFYKDSWKDSKSNSYDYTLTSFEDYLVKEVFGDKNASVWVIPYPFEYGDLVEYQGNQYLFNFYEHSDGARCSLLDKDSKEEVEFDNSDYVNSKDIKLISKANEIVESETLTEDDMSEEELVDRTKLGITKGLEKCKTLSDINGVIIYYKQFIDSQSEDSKRRQFTTANQDDLEKEYKSIYGDDWSHWEDWSLSKMKEQN